MNPIPEKITIYVVDDDEAVRDSLQWLLEGKGYRVRCFDSSETFLTRYDPREVACLFVDIRMNGMSGLELQDKLIERKSPLPIVFITAHGDVPMAVETMKKGALDFIQKPFDENKLFALVEKMQERAQAAFVSHQRANTREILLGKLTNREAQVLAQLRAGHARIADVVPVLYAAVDPRLWPAASLSVLSHLIKLVKEGRVSADPEPAMTARYRLID